MGDGESGLVGGLEAPTSDKVSDNQWPIRLPSLLFSSPSSSATTTRLPYKEGGPLRRSLNGEAVDALKSFQLSIGYHSIYVLYASRKIFFSFETTVKALKVESYHLLF